MSPRFLTIAKYEVKQYRRNYFEQFFVFAGIALVFIMVSGTDEGVTFDAPSSFGLYRIGYLDGTALGGHTHYSTIWKPYTSREDGIRSLESGEIDVWAEEYNGSVSFKTTETQKSQSALKRVKQILMGAKRDRIYTMAETNYSLDGILLPVKVRVAEYVIDYGNSIDPNIYTHRGRLLNRAAMDNGETGHDVNILNPDDVRRLNLTQYMDSIKQESEKDSVDRSGFTLPEEWEVPFVFTTLYHNMAVVSASILLSILLTLSFAAEKVNNTINILFQTPATKLDILAGKTLPYFSLMAIINLVYALSVANGADALRIFYIFTVLSATLSAFAVFTVLTSRTYREATFTGSLSLLSFLIFLVFPNVFSGINLLAFTSPLDTVTSIQNRAEVPPLDVFISLLPYKFMFLFFTTATVVCFSPETFHNTPGTKYLIRIFYTSLQRHVDGPGYVAAAVTLLVPFVYITQTLTAYLILPLGAVAPYSPLLLLAFIEEAAKILPYHYNRKINPIVYGITAGTTFFATEKIFNLYLISKVYAHLPAPYTVFIAKGLVYTLILHIATASILATITHKWGGRWGTRGGLLLTTLIHYTYNMYMISGGLLK